HRWQLIQCLLRWAFLAVWFLVLQASVIPLQLGDKYPSLWSLLIATLALSGLFQLLPNKRILLCRGILTAAATLFFGIQLFTALSEPSRSEAVVLDSPFRAEALVFHGGRSALVNHHYPLRSQRDAMDIIV